METIPTWALLKNKNTGVTSQQFNAKSPLLVEKAAVPDR